ncbi:MAG: hypothetical protein J7L12_03655 [Desulfurococcales archaeon]|nr:hypothetical protein [Desulfurococcales archaeon]
MGGYLGENHTLSVSNMFYLGISYSSARRGYR